MGKTDWKAEAKALKKKLRKLKAAPSGKGGGAKPVSPLAPANFPALPLIRGVEFAAVEAGVRYQNRKDVMLVRLAPGTAMGFMPRQRPSPMITSTAEMTALVAIPYLDASERIAPARPPLHGQMPFAIG